MIYLQNRIMKKIMVLAALCFQHVIKSIVKTFMYFDSFCSCTRFVTIYN